MGRGEPGVERHHAGLGPEARVEQLTGIGKRMPKTMWCYLLLSLALVGIPPTGGFISKS